MAIEWHLQSNSALAAAALATAVAEALRQTLAHQPQAVLAVSGGRSPIAFFQALSQQQLDWPRIKVTLVDERIVSPDHADNNGTLVRQYLLQNQAALAQWQPLVRAEATPAHVVDEALQHYCQPDVVVLGMGTDGHTASLFPHAPQLEAGLSRKTVAPLLHVTPVGAPYERISMTFRAIEAASYVFLAIAGAEKKAVLMQALAAPDVKLPVSYVLHSDHILTHVYFND